MAIPKPRKTDSEQEYVSRCMRSRLMRKEFPDEAQHAAVCYSEFRKGNPIGKSAKKSAVKKKAVPKKKAVSRPSQATGKKPTKRLVERRKKTASAPKGYFANPIVGEKAAPFYVAFVEHEGDRYYYGGSKTDGTPLFDTDIERAFLSHESKPMMRHVKAEAMAHIRGKGLKLKVIRVYIDKKGKVIPGE
jgi:hypothetical protein